MCLCILYNYISSFLKKKKEKKNNDVQNSICQILLIFNNNIYMISFTNDNSNNGKIYLCLLMKLSDKEIHTE